MANINAKFQDNSADRLLALVRQLNQELHPSRTFSTIHLDTSLDRDLGLDSLSRVELLSRLEKNFKVTLPEQILATAETPRDFLRAILTASGRGQAVSLKKETVTALTDTDTPEQAETLVQALEHHVRLHSDHPHIRLYDDQSEGEVITYQDLWQEAGRIGAALQSQGLALGETVLIMLPTSRQYFLAFFGILMAGGVPVPLYPPGRLKQIEEHLRRHAAIAENSFARLMIVIPEAKPFAKLMHHQATNLKQVLTMEELLQAAPEGSLPRLPNIQRRDTGFLQYTSGSTGMPKGVVLSHANLLANVRAMGRVLRVTSKDVFVSWLPLYHDMGLIGAWLGSLYHGCPLVVMPPLSFIARPIRWFQAIHRYGGTLSAAPNFAYELCLRRISDTDMAGIDLSSWRCAFNGAEAVSPATVEGFSQRFAAHGFSNQAMMPVYGLAESSVGLAFPLQSRKPVIDRVERQTFMASGRAVQASEEKKTALRFVACGQPLPGHQVRVVDPSGRELPDRQEGRLQFQGPSTTSGYFRNPEASTRLFQDQWLDSGDMAYVAEGDIYITGRSKDIIIRAGRNIYPTELEEAIAQLDGVSKGNVAVFGSEDRQSATERLIVLAETRKRKPEAREALRTAINAIVNDLSGLPPDEVVLAPPNTVLKTSSGKVRRAACMELFDKDLIGKPQRAVWLQVVRFGLSGLGPRLRRLGKGAGALLYASYAWILFGLVSLVLWPMVAVVPGLRNRWACTRVILRLLTRLACIPLQVEGLQNLPTQGKPYILVANHASYLDGLILGAALPGPLSFVAKAELRRSFWLRVLLGRLGTEFVDRFDQKKGVEDAHGLAERAKQGAPLVFFPEGTFMRMPGLLPFRLGSFETAINTNLPVVPVALRGTRSVLRGDSWFPRWGTVRVVVGEPIKSADTPGQDRWARVLALRDLTRAWTLLHCGEPDLKDVQPELFGRERGE